MASGDGESRQRKGGPQKIRENSGKDGTSGIVFSACIPHATDLGLLSGCFEAAFELLLIRV